MLDTAHAYLTNQGTVTNLTDNALLKQHFESQS